MTKQIQAPLIALDNKYGKSKDMEAIQIAQRDADDRYYMKAMLQALPPRYLRKVIEKLG